MFNNVLVGVDGHEGGEDAIALARMLVADGGDLTLAYVSPGDPYARPATTGRRVQAVERAEKLLEQARERAGVAANLRWRRSSSAGRGLHELAEVIDADLLVVGSSARGLLGRVLLGDDTRAALNGAPCAVAVAPAGYSRRPESVGVIGVGYDGSPQSEHALQVASGLAAQTGAKLSAFEVVSLPKVAFGPGPLPVSDTIDALVEQARRRMAAVDGVEARVAYGQPADELAAYSASVDLLIVGSRGYGPIGRLVHGSTSQQLARAARCPLVVLTRVVRQAHTRASSRDEQREVTPTAPVARASAAPSTAASRPSA